MATISTRGDNDFKRKISDTPTEDSLAKRHSALQNSQHAQLVTQNSILASMLAQTPVKPPPVPTRMASALISQLPQERLPENLKEKLLQSPYTGLPTSEQLNISTNQNASVSSDPWLSPLLDDVCDMEEEYKISRQGCLPREILADSNKMASAINYIKMQLMRCEATIASDSPLIRMIKQFDAVTVPQVVLQQNVASPSSYASANQIPTSSPNHYSVTNNSTHRIQSPELGSQQPSNLDKVMTCPQRSDGQGLPQYREISHNIKASKPPQKKKKITIEQLKEMIAQQQQIRLIPKPIRIQLPMNARQVAPKYNVAYLQSHASAPSPDTRNCLLDSTPASNVIHQQNPRMAQRPLLPQYNPQQTSNSPSPPQNPPQMSPVQDKQTSFQRTSQQYQLNYHQVRPESLQPCSGQVWSQQHTSSPQNPPSLRQQNQVLSSNLLQAQKSSQQLLLASHQPHQMVVHSAAPGSQNYPDSHFQQPSFYHQQPDATMSQQPLLAQAPHQKMQRMASSPIQANSPHSPAGFTPNEPISPPQSSPSHFNPPYSTCNTSMPMSPPSNFISENFSYNQQLYPASVVDRNHGNGGYCMTFSVLSRVATCS